ncbi:hypothetical protein FSO04_41925 [Paraburkholderia madseniana]|jgi:hypothetical protein|uniref:Uncharacterized protein n=1 Tax=Paraburkholderia madseniana TaxID=2599607 RepID=A0A6N6W3A3_9BURK|nr:hypothetical protein [Paraburkholderia madseniana]KAE8754010.1 hypothetical protein FSO04_41925 [Paraburkholderia madseniana]
MNSHHTTVLSMLPPWLGIAVGHIVDNASISNLASIASIAYCLVGVYVMLRRNSHGDD